jgi:hypothetical protein
MWDELVVTDEALVKIPSISKDLTADTGGEGEIRTPDTVARMPHFECGAFNHSATSPHAEVGG